jgi:hypothetical protein
VKRKKRWDIVVMQSDQLRTSYLTQSDSGMAKAALMQGADAG